MKILSLRNATLILESGPQRILVDPMLGRKGSLPPLSLLRHRPRRNPLVELPADAAAALETVTAGLVTHCRLHLDHLDRAGARLLARRGVPVWCNHLDRAYLGRRGIRTVPLRPGKSSEFLDGKITAVKTAHAATG